jgi:hypothetical protein
MILSKTHLVTLLQSNVINVVTKKINLVTKSPFLWSVIWMLTFWWSVIWMTSKQRRYPKTIGTYIKLGIQHACNLKFVDAVVEKNAERFLAIEMEKVFFQMYVGMYIPL